MDVVKVKDSKGLVMCPYCVKEFGYDLAMANNELPHGCIYCKERFFIIQENITGADKDAPIVTNAQGGKQSKINTAFSLVPHDSLLAVAKVMKIGSERYEKDNWRRLSTDEIYDHLQEHLVKWYMTGNMEDLEHAITRGMMLYSVANKEG